MNEGGSVLHEQRRPAAWVGAGLILLASGCVPAAYGEGDNGRSPLPPQSSQADPIDRPPTNILPTQQAWEARPVVPSAQNVAAELYTVQTGDTLLGIARKTGAGSDAIARANGILPPFSIRPGQKIAIPAGRYHLVQSGETGIAIARAYGVQWSRVVADNQLSEPYILRAGQRILIPGSAVPTLSERAAAFHLDIDDIVTGGQPALAETTTPARPSPSVARALPPTTPVAGPVALRGGFRWPVNGTLLKRFGPAGSGQRNDGIKIGVPRGTPVLATSDGVVAYTGAEVAGLGGLVILKHGSGWTSVYGHNEQILVQRGQAVKQGQTLALSGDTGFAERPELHFELRRGRTPVDPLAELPKR
ncbi:MAG: peptidoglycan DD-metalloendopeptidase family protein [Sphingomonas sp.]